MTKSELAKLLSQNDCRVIGWEDVGYAGHRSVIALLAQAFNRSETALLAEPSLAGHSKRPPDIVLIDPEIGIHIIEVKGILLSQIESIEAGGILRIRYSTPVARPHNVLKQAREAMFDVKDATSRAFWGRSSIAL